MKRILLVCYFSFTIITLCFPQKDTVKYTIGITEQNFFCDYGVFVEKRLATRHYMRYDIGKVFKDYIGDENYNISGFSTGLNYLYSWKNSKSHPFIQFGITYRYFKADSVLYESDTWLYSVSTKSNGISCKTGWGYTFSNKRISFSSVLGLQLYYETYKKSNFNVIYDIFKVLHKASFPNNSFYFMPVLDFSIGWNLY